MIIMGSGLSECSIAQFFSNRACPDQYSQHPYARRAVTLEVENEMQSQRLRSPSPPYRINNNQPDLYG